MPVPMRLLWRDDFFEALNVPAALERVDSGVERFWHGLAYFGQGMFAEAECRFIQAVQSRCDHQQVLWYLALAAEKCRDRALAEKAATSVVRLTPNFAAALDLLIQVNRQDERPAVGVLSLVGSGCVEAVGGRLAGPGVERFHPVHREWPKVEFAGEPVQAATMVITPSPADPTRLEVELRREIERFNKVVIWGLKTQKHTHSHIHRHFYSTLEKLDAKVVLVDDSRENTEIVEANDLIVSIDVASSHLPVREGVFYCLHNCSDDIHRRIAPSRNIRLQTYISSAEQTSEKWDKVTFFDAETRTLYQPWATDLLADEFAEPILNPAGSIVFWVGSIWNDRLNRGNINEIRALKDVLDSRGMRFVPLQGVSDLMNIRYVRSSRIAPAIVGRWQMQNNYLPCRMWKNISYGQLGVSNVSKLADVFDGCTVKGRTIEELIDNTLSLPSGTYRDMICRQQEIVKNNHTYVNRMLNIIRAFESVENC